MLREFKCDKFFVNYNETDKQLVCGKFESSLMKWVFNKQCAGNNLKNNKGKQWFQILTIPWYWENFKMISSLLKKQNSQTNCMQKGKLEMRIYLQIWVQSCP